MKEKTAKFPSYSTEYLDDEIGGDDPDLDPLISDINVQKSLDTESEPEVHNHLPTWAQKTLSSAGDNIGNPDDPQRTWSDFQRVGFVLSCSDNFLSKTWYLIIILDPKSYYHAQNDPRYQVYLGASFSSSGKEIGSMQVGVSDKGCC